MVIINKFGKTAEEIDQIEKNEGKLNKKFKRKLLFLNDHQSLTLDEILDFQNSQKIDLPEDYVEFLTKHNGGEPDNKVFSNDKVINFFLCCKSDK